MAQRGESARTDMFDVLGYSCLCSWCKMSAGCVDYNRHHYESIMNRINGYPVSCSNHVPEYYRGIDGVRP